MFEQMCPNCGKPLHYNEKTGLFKCRNGRCGRSYTLAAFRRRNINKSRIVSRKGIMSNRSNGRNNERSL